MPKQTMLPFGKKQYTISEFDIFRSPSYWEKFSDDELLAYAQLIRKFYRERGYPYYKLSLHDKYQLFRQLTTVNVTELLQNDIIRQTMHGLNIAWSYFPHAPEVPCNNCLTPMQVFTDDTLFLKAILKMLKIGFPVSDAGLRKILRIFSSTQMVSNFRPTAAMCIYKHFAPSRAKVWDMSAGFGGRLLGALASSHIRTYIGTDPADLTIQGLTQMATELNTMQKDVQLYQIGSEDYLPEKESLDVCFSSPPYFNHEKYSIEPTQSYVKFSTPKQWMQGFLLKTIDNCWHGLKHGGYLILNIADVTNYPTLCADFLEGMKATAFTYQKMLRLELSKLIKTEADQDFKYEPVYVFQKE